MIQSLYWKLRKKLFEFLGEDYDYISFSYQNLLVCNEVIIVVILFYKCRSWVEDEARKSQARAKVLEEVGRRWRWNSHA